MDLKVLKMLGCNKIIDQLTEYAASPLGKELYRGLTPLSGLEETRTWQVQTTDAVTRVRLKGTTSFAGVRGIRDSLKYLGIGSSLNIPELLSINPNITAAARAKACGRHEAEDDGSRQDKIDTPDSLEPLSAGLEPLTSPNNEIKRCILSEGEVADGASPGLSHARRPMKVITNRTHTQLNSILNSNRSYLQGAITTVRDGRYYLPVRSEYKNQVFGMVHDQLTIGSTLFIEPMAIIKLNNEVRELEIQKQKGIKAILAPLSNQTMPFTEESRMDQKLLPRLDFIFAKAGLTRRYRCSAPVSSNRGFIHTKGGRHPLLNPQSVIPTNIWLGKDFDLLIVINLDTDGKTVSLKTVRLSTLTDQSGLHVLAWEGSELAVFDEMFTDIDDEQSIERSLSTFSAHTTNIARILGGVDARSLCLFDELDAGIDPTEDVTLAIAILSFLHSMKCRAMATTHYSELRVLALGTQDVESTRCEFSVETLQPIYGLLISIPGESNVFAISRKLRLPDYIIEDAKNYLEAKDKSFEDLLSNLESSRLTIEKEQAEISTYKGEIVKLKPRLTQKEECLDGRRDKVIRNATKEAQRILRKAKRIADQTIKQINKLAASSGVNEELEEQRAKLRDQMRKTDKKLAVKVRDPSRPVSPKRLKIGDGIKALSMNLKGTVSILSNTKGDLYTQMDILRSLVNTKDLELLNEKDINAALGDGSSYNYGGKSSAKSRGSSSSQAEMSKSASISMEVSLIGVTTDEALPVIKKYLDDVYLARLQSVRVAHRRGTGTLENAVRERLYQLKYVKEPCLGQLGGGDSGVTIATFK